MTIAGLLWIGSFRLAVLLVAALALVRGRGPERIGAALFVVATGASWLVLRHNWQFVGFEPGLAAIDFGVLLVLWVLSTFAMRWWPMIAFGAQLITCVGHGARLLDPTLAPLTYARLTAFSGWPTLTALACGVIAVRWRRTRLPSWRSSLALPVHATLARLRLG